MGLSERMRSSVAFPKVILIAGPKFSGKSRFVEQILPKLREQGLEVTGFFQRGVFDAEGTKTGYDLVSAQDGSAFPLARRAGPDSYWKFDEKAFASTTEMVTGQADVCVLDEIGPLELSGRGHAAVLGAALRMRVPLIIVVREELLGELRRRLPADREATILHFMPGKEAGLLRHIIETLSP